MIVHPESNGDTVLVGRRLLVARLKVLGEQLCGFEGAKHLAFESWRGSQRRAVL
jgi:hypothetical protein